MPKVELNKWGSCLTLVQREVIPLHYACVSGQRLEDLNEVKRLQYACVSGQRLEDLTRGDPLALCLCQRTEA